METTEALFLLRQLGLAFEVNGGRLDVSPAELLDDDVVWLIRKHRDAIIAELLDDSPAWAWAVHFAGRAPMDLYCHPERTRREVMAQHPTATAADRLPECRWPHDPNKGEHP